MKLQILFAILHCSLYLLMQTGCKKNIPLYPDNSSSPELSISILDTSCTEVWLQASLKNITPPFQYELYRDSVLCFAGSLFVNDTVFIDTTLLSNHIYNYHLKIIEKEKNLGSSKTLLVKTMDTTSHQIVWTVQTLGDGNASVIHDVSILNDSLAYAVGEIYLKSNGVFSDRYNFAQWDGKNWDLKRVMVSYNGNPVTVSIRGIYAFSDSQIWLGASLPIYGDGKNWKLFDVRSIPGMDSLSFQRCWGTSPDDMYFVGLGGSIGHYSKGTWTRIESGTRTTIGDIWGGIDPNTKEHFAICNAHMTSTSDNALLIQIKRNVASKMPDDGLTMNREAIWFVPERKYLSVGDGIYAKRSKEDQRPWVKYPSELSTPYYSKAIRGLSLNDIVVSGSFGVVAHFNGVTWRKYQETYNNGECRAIALNKNIIMAVGTTDTKGYIAIGKR